MPVHKNNTTTMVLLFVVVVWVLYAMLKKTKLGTIIDI
jgi:hypothetical protein